MPPEVSMKILECLKTIDSKMQSHSVAVAELLEPKSTNEIETLKTVIAKLTQKVTEIENTQKSINELISFLKANPQFGNAEKILNKLANYNARCNRYVSNLKNEVIVVYLKINKLTTSAKQDTEQKPKEIDYFGDEMIAPALVDLYTNKNFITKLTSKLKNKFATTFKPQKPSSNTIKGKQLCIEANKILTKKKDISDIQRYEFVINHLELAKNYFNNCDDEILFDLCQKSIENVDILLTKAIKTKADSLFENAINLFKNNHIVDSKSNFVSALKLYKRIDDEKMISQINDYISKCNYLLTLDEARTKFAIGKTKMENEEFDDAEFYFVCAKNLFFKINRTEDVNNCLKMIEKNKVEKQRFIDNCKKHAMQEYNDGNYYYEKEWFVNAIEHFEASIKWYKKIGNQNCINLCRERINKCKVGQGNELFNQACDEMDTAPLEAIKTFEQAIEYYTEGENDACVNKCNAKIANCYNLIGNSYYERGYNKYDVGVCLDEAIDLLKTALEYYQKADYKDNIVACSNLIADSYFKKGQKIIDDVIERSGYEDYYSENIDMLYDAIDYFKQTINYSYSDSKSYFANLKIDDCERKISDLEYNLKYEDEYEEDEYENEDSSY